MKNLLLLFCFVLSCVFGKAQNLVPNGSFEVYDTCPNNLSQISYAFPWTFPFGTSDYFNSCAGSGSIISVPTNWCGHQYARTGNGYAGFILRDGGYLEYLQVELTDTLIAGRKYCVSFYLSLADSFAYTISSVGLYFSDTAIIATNYYPLPYTPQIQNPPAAFINETGWTEVSGNYIAQGGEKFITIGNFNPNIYPDSLLLNTDTVPHFNGGPCCWYDYGNGDTIYHSPWSSYFYLDDVSIVHCDLTEEADNLNDDVVVSIYPNPAKLLETITVQIPFQGDIPNINITDLAGREINSKSTFLKTKKEYIFQIQLVKGAEGIYFISIYFNNKQYIKKLIIIN